MPLPALLDHHWATLVRLRQGVIAAGCGEEAIHDLRVGSRRLRALIDLLEPAVGRRALRRLRRPIRGLTRELGQLRNLDESRRLLQELEEPDLTPLLGDLAHRRRRESRRILRLVEELPCKRLQRGLRDAAARMPAGGRLAGLLSSHSLTLYRPIHDLLQLPRLAELAIERHALRIAIKKWRYFTELLEQLTGRDQTTLLAQLKTYQGLLGDLNDRELLLTQLQQDTGLTAETRERTTARMQRRRLQLVRRFTQLLMKQPLQYHYTA